MARRILHLGLGGFHRAHMAVYTAEAMQLAGDASWGIAGVGMLETDRALVAALQRSGGSYDVLEKGVGVERLQRVEAIREALLYPDAPQAVLDRAADAGTDIVSLTVTEKGYCLGPDGALDESHPGIVHDVQTTQAPPRTAVGLLAAAIARRQTPLTVLSCDNIPHNGDTCRAAVEALLQLQGLGRPAVLDEVAFPNSMVDRITPTAGPDPSQPLVCEPFRQWVLEDAFAGPRPAWELAGAQFVPDVAPYELAKIRMLNVAHSVLCYPALMAGHRQVHEAMADPAMASMLERCMRTELAPTVPAVPGLDLDAYATTLLERFANPAVADQLERIAQDGSSKFAQQLLPVVRAAAAQGRETPVLAAAVAAWVQHLGGRDRQGRAFRVTERLALSGGAGTLREAFGEEGLAGTGSLEEEVEGMLAL